MHRDPACLQDLLSDSDSDNDLEMLLIATENEERRSQNRRRGGSIRRRRTINRNRIADHNRLYQDSSIRSTASSVALSPPRSSTLPLPSRRHLRRSLPLAAPSIDLTLSPPDILKEEESKFTFFSI